MAHLLLFRLSLANLIYNCTLYGAGQKTGILNVEAKLSKVLASQRIPVTATKDLIAERQDVAGLAKILGIDNESNPDYVPSPTEILEAQRNLAEMIKSGNIDKEELKQSLKWLHTKDVELTQERYERATFKIHDADGKRLSAEKINANKAKFEKRSQGNTEQYLARQLVEELDELLEERLKAQNVPKASKSYALIEAQKRALKSARFGDDTVINDTSSKYHNKTNREAVEISAREVGLLNLKGKSTDDIVLEINQQLALEIDRTVAPSDGMSTRLVVKASERDTVLNEISARMARYEKWDPDTYNDLKALRNDVKDVFNKGLPMGDDIMEQLYFLDYKTRSVVEKMSRSYDNTVTPDDFALIGKIMSEKLGEQVPILRDFTKYFGRLAEDFLVHANPKEADFDWKAIAKRQVFGPKKQTLKFNPKVAEILGLDAKTPVSQQILKRFSWYKPDSTISDLLYGVNEEKFRRTGKKLTFGEIEGIFKAVDEEILFPNKMPKKWNQVPWVNFDGAIVEQNFTQTFEERLRYKDENGNWVTNILQIDQKTEPTWWQETLNLDGNVNDIADVQKARTAYAVNANHSNDATLVKQFHLWGKENKVPTATVHDAFFSNVADMSKSKEALRQMYANALERNVAKETLDEMLARGLPRDLYDKYLNEAMDIGIIPVAGRSKIGNRIITEDDILKASDILKKIDDDFKQNYSWYGIGG